MTWLGICVGEEEAMITVSKYHMVSCQCVWGGSDKARTTPVVQENFDQS
jgi:hypothetical protein